MNIALFCQEHELPKMCELYTSKLNTYEGTSTPINYLKLAKAIKETGQDYLVLSRGLAEAINAGELSIKDADVTMSELGLYGCIRPGGILVGTIELW